MGTGAIMLPLIRQLTTVLSVLLQNLGINRSANVISFTASGTSRPSRNWRCSILARHPAVGTQHSALGHTVVHTGHVRCKSLGSFSPYGNGLQGGSTPSRKRLETPSGLRPRAVQSVLNLTAGGSASPRFLLPRGSLSTSPRPKMASNLTREGEKRCPISASTSPLCRVPPSPIPSNSTPISSTLFPPLAAVMLVKTGRQ